MRRRSRRWSSATWAPLTYAAVMDGSVWVILPTYDEAENLEAVVGGIRAAVPDAHVLVVDDNSRDGTAELADALAAEDRRLDVLHRPGKAGLGRAYTAGSAAPRAAGAGPGGEMAPALPRAPPPLPGLTAAAPAPARALGSPYAPGGGTENWGLARRVLSRAGCAYARRALGVDVRDLTGGFKCFRASALQAIEYPSAGATGYAFQVELTWRALQLGLRVVEVPIRFR